MCDHQKSLHKKNRNTLIHNGNLNYPPVSLHSDKGHFISKQRGQFNLRKRARLAGFFSICMKLYLKLFNIQKNTEIKNMIY